MIFLIFPVFLSAQNVTIETLPAGPVSIPGDLQHILSFQVNSSDPVRVSSCTVSFEEEFFRGINRIYGYVDSVPYFSPPPYLFHNPYTDNLTVVVGLADDTVRVFDYFADIVGGDLGQTSITVSCLIDPYTTSDDPFLLPEISFTHDVVLDIPSISQDELALTDWNIYTLEGKQIKRNQAVVTSRLSPGIYILWSEDKKFHRKILVR